MRISLDSFIDKRTVMASQVEDTINDLNIYPCS